MNSSKLSLLIALLISTLIVSCSKDETKPDPNKGLVGEKGNPRFNLVFTNEENADLDLYVMDPDGNIIFWNNPSSASGGELDVDCTNCIGCPQGPAENIFWPVGDNTAPTGTYTYWVQYYVSSTPPCNTIGSSEFTVKVLSGNTLKETRTGTLSSGISATWTYTHE